jgi:hypothetical protein
VRCACPPSRASSRRACLRIPPLALAPCTFPRALAHRFRVFPCPCPCCSPSFRCSSGRRDLVAPSCPRSPPSPCPRPSRSNLTSRPAPCYSIRSLDPSMHPSTPSLPFLTLHFPPYPRVFASYPDPPRSTCQDSGRGRQEEDFAG